MPVYEPGQILGGKYRLIRQLGRGGMGRVWLAHHATLNAPVALKVIAAGKLGPDAAQRFLGEARMAAALRSPHVVQILDYGVDDGVPHIAMEVLEGETLAQRLERVQRLSMNDTARVLQQVVRAVARAHEAGVVHRDLKPENIFIVQNDDEELIKVLDFGIAKAGPGMLGSSVAHETRTGAILGTPYYMSPEQVDGLKSVDFSSDVWALGVVAYQCLLGTLPFQGDSVGRLVLAICTHPMPVPSSAGSVPEGFDAWFARACAREPTQRFSSARQAVSELLALSDGAPSSTASRSDGGPASAPVLSSTPARSRAPDPLHTTTGQASNAELRARSSTAQRVRRTAPALALLALAALAFIGWRLFRPAVEPVRAAAAPVLSSPSPSAPALAPVDAPAPAPRAPAVLPSTSTPAPTVASESSAAGQPAAPSTTPAPQRLRAARPKPSAPAAGGSSAPSTRVPSKPPADLDLGI